MPRHRDSDERDTAELSVTFKGAETELAYLVYDHFSEKEVWIPFSVTVERHGHLKGGDGTVVVHEWFAKREGLI